MDQAGLNHPPPAYSEQEFDQKISIALLASLSAAQPPRGGELEEQWEEWDDPAFHAAAQAISSWDSQVPTGILSSQGFGASASSQVSHPPTKAGDDAQSPDLPPTVEPLRIHKKRRASSGQSKTRPSWFADAEIDAQSSASGSMQHDVPPEDEEDHSIPPPPFTDVDPSLDGRPVIVSYQSSGDSRTPSPLNSPVRRPLAYDRDSMSLSQPSSRIQPDHPQPYVEQLHASSQATSSTYRSTRRSLPAIPAVPNPHNIGQRHLTTSESSPRPIQNSPTPRMNFNPYVAYGQGGGISELPARHLTQHFDPTGFYKYGQLDF